MDRFRSEKEKTKKHNNKAAHTQPQNSGQASHHLLALSHLLNSGPFKQLPTRAKF